MISDQNLNLSIAHSRIALLQAESASERLACGNGRMDGTGRKAGGRVGGGRGSIVTVVVVAVRHVAAVAAVASRRHPAGKAA
jgi:hypothetical protein